MYKGLAVLLPDRAFFKVPAERSKRMFSFSSSQLEQPEVYARFLGGVDGAE